MIGWCMNQIVRAVLVGYGMLIVLVLLGSALATLDSDSSLHAPRTAR